MRNLTRCVSLFLLALLVAYPEGRASSSGSESVRSSPQAPQALQAKTSIVPNLQFQGTVTCTITGNTVRVEAPFIANLGSTSLPVYVALRASTQPQRFGESLGQSILLARFFVGTLEPGTEFANVDSGVLSYSRPPAGTYFLFATAEEDQSYDDLYPFPNTETFGAVCVEDATTHCLNGGRFSVQANWSVPAQGTSGVGNAIPLVGGDTGYFWFFSSNAAELMVKIVDGRAVNGRFWFFYGALSNVQYSITVTDTVTGAVKTYQNPSGNLASVADTNAFSDSGGGPLPSPTPTSVSIQTPTPSPALTATSTPTPTSSSLAGNWQGTISSADPTCPVAGSQNLAGTFSQSGASFMGTFGLPAGASAVFQGNIFEGSVSGVFTTTSAGCSGSGSFSGTLSGSQLTISVPTVSTIDLDCSFCQQNTVVLTRTGP